MSAFVYFLPLTEIQMSAPLQAQLLRWLSADELARVNNITRSSQRQIQALYVRVVLRMVLSRHGDITPQAWQFDYGSQGKPELIKAQYLATGLSFNISHSGEWLMIGLLKQAPDGLRVTDKPLFGVDIERNRDKTDIYPILNHYFSPQETTHLLALDEQYQRQRFFDLWSIKESYIKAEGSGLALSLKSFSVNFSAQQTSAVELNTQGALPLNESLNKRLPDPLVPLMAQSASTRLNVVERIAIDVDDSHRFSHDRDCYGAQNWHVFMGRLNQTYRFAVSVNMAVSNNGSNTINQVADNNVTSNNRARLSDLDNASHNESAPDTISHPLACATGNSANPLSAWQFYQLDWQHLLFENGLI
ncbi:4'-phosphopantetheinyl transferase family protein [Shewanella intestini]|uniref:4'-phosphopantetheinyl transferase superfamily protein n=1 Tax=Shewanella intestini TaxID=2017544 RepID=A0ABS5I021_9GAMM|nr:MULTISPECIES: 4'-phosphopantetheinyl transferase superfamily protein [Shewanella]MBR9727366.1 4'-phosphopantetheinyl transferase superfamily protein [Shewanella intestini]MRG35584.1 4'-phosphopantetheinyl transferase superfamily protein [Shewanella sp. XMDDZSB0408]